MEAINNEFTEHLQTMGFNANFAHGFYTFANKLAGEGFTLRVDGDKFTIQNFAFIKGEQVIGEAASESVLKGIEYLEDVLNMTEQDTQQTLGPHAEVATVSDNVPAKSENKIGDIEQKAIDEHPGTIAALLMLQNTPDSLVLSRKGSGGKMLSYVEGHDMRKMINFACLFNWSTKEVSIREDDYEFSAIVVCEFVFTEGYTVTKTQVGTAQKKFSRTLKDADDKPRCIMIGDTIKSAITDGEKKCISELGVCQDVYSGVHKAKGLK